MAGKCSVVGKDNEEDKTREQADRKSCIILMFCLFKNKQSAGGCKLKGNLLADPTTVSLSKACQ